MALLNKGLVSTLRAGTMEVVHEMTDILSPLIHAVEQPIAGVYRDVKEVVAMPSHIYHTAVKVGTYWMIGWLSWTAFSEIFPREKRMLVRGMDRAFKRVRVR